MKLDRSMRIRGPVQNRKLQRMESGQEFTENVKKRIVILVTCQVVDPAAKFDTQDNANTNPEDASRATPDARKPGKELTFRVGTSVIRIDGNVQADTAKRTSDNEIEVHGENLHVVFEEPDVSPEHYSQLQCDSGSFTIQLNSPGDAFDAISDWRLRGNVVFQMNADEKSMQRLFIV